MRFPDSQAARSCSSLLWYPSPNCSPQLLVVRVLDWRWTLAALGDYREDFLLDRRARQRGVVPNKVLLGICSQASSKLPPFAKSPALGIGETGRVHREDLEPSPRRPQTFRDDRPSLYSRQAKR